MMRLLMWCVTRVAGELYRSLIAYGRLWLYLPDPPPPPRDPRTLERVRPDIPLTPVERALERQLLDLDS